MLTNPFGSKVNINPLTVNNFNKDVNQNHHTTPPPTLFYLLQENGSFLLLENGGRIILT